MRKIKTLLLLITMLLLTGCEELFEMFSVSFSNIESSSIYETSSSIKESSNPSVPSGIESTPKIKYLTDYDSNDNDLDVRFLQLENKSSQKQSGDAIYLSIGNIDILIDAGTKGIGTNSVVPYLEKYVTDDTLELVISTHMDVDHIGGMVGNKSSGVYTGVFNAGFNILNVIDCGFVAETETYKEYKLLLDSLITNGTNYYKYEDMIHDENTPNQFYLGKDCIMTILDTKMYNFSSSDENDYSVPCLIEHGQIRYLLTGDCEKKAEANLALLNIGQVDLFKAAHHGSPTSNTEVFLDTVMPKNVIICSSYSNSYYLPKKEVIDRFVEKYTENVYGTFLNGTIHAFSNKTDLSLWCEGYYDYANNNGNLLEGTTTLIPIQNSEWYKTAK